MRAGYTGKYFLSELAAKRKDEKTGVIQFQNKEERLQNEFFTLARTLQQMAIDKENESLFDETDRAHYDQITQII